MSDPAPPRPAKLLVGFFLGQQTLAGAVMEGLESHFGPLDLVSPWLPFDYTDYYAREMGTPLYRRIVAFKRLVDQAQLPDIKHLTNAMEADHAANDCRAVNIDPGYLLLERLVLATGKNFSHRIYLRRGIYADLTLVYRKGRFESLPWTYPDYADARLQAFLHQVRKKYALDLAKAPHGVA
ncbi:MAG: DUF4416 family protein [Desulfobacterales bacterium]|jgi:hypothetical protein